MIKKLLREPLIHFIGLGALIFGYYSFVNADSDSEDSFEIRLDESDINRIKSAYELSWSQTPDSTTLARLIEDEVRSEILSREAKRLNLHHNDEIIRRRLVQKYEFLIGDVANGAQPTSEEIESFYESNIERYKSEPTYSFYHFYFKDKPNRNAKESYELTALDDKRVMEVLNKMEHHDPLHVPKFQNKKTILALNKTLGNDFSETLLNHKKMGWVETAIQSGFGYHLVYITDYQESETIPLEQIKSKVIKDWKDRQGTDFKNRLYENLKDEYDVKVIQS